jgi:hypothetical protein
MPVIISAATSGATTIQATDAVTAVITLPSATDTLVGKITPSFTTTIGVGNATPSASGAGITFPATQSASTDANTLDDYEEGTWTPAITAGTGSFTTVTGQVGTYTKWGNVVTVNYFYIVSTIGTGGAWTNIGSLPFTIKNVNSWSVGSGTSGNDTLMRSTYGQANTTTMQETLYNGTASVITAGHGHNGTLTYLT